MLLFCDAPREVTIGAFQKMYQFDGVDVCRVDNFIHNFSVKAIKSS